MGQVVQVCLDRRVVEQGARLVSDLEPGTVSVACTGVGVDGACQLLTASILPCPIRVPPWDICVGDSR